MTRKGQILTYRTERAAKQAMVRLLKRYPVHADCKVRVTLANFHPFQYVIEVSGRDGRSGYWSRA